MRSEDGQTLSHQVLFYQIKRIILPHNVMDVIGRVENKPSAIRRTLLQPLATTRRGTSEGPYFCSAPDKEALLRLNSYEGAVSAYSCA